MHGEYKTVKLLCNLKKNMLDTPHLDEALNKMSREGWELVTYSSYVTWRWLFGAFGNSDYIIATFKRSKG